MGDLCQIRQRNCVPYLLKHNGSVSAPREDMYLAGCRVSLQWLLGRPYCLKKDLRKMKHILVIIYKVETCFMEIRLTVN